MNPRQHADLRAWAVGFAIVLAGMALLGRACPSIAASVPDLYGGGRP